MPLGERWTVEQERKWWSAPGREKPPEPDRKGGGAVIVAIGAVAGLLALLGIAAASGGGGAPPTKKKTVITITSWAAVPYGAGFNYSVIGFLKDETGAPVKGRDVWLWYCRRVGFIIHCESLVKGTTDSTGRFSVTGFRYIPLALLLKLTFAGDANYYATETDIELLAEFPVYW